MFFDGGGYQRQGRGGAPQRGSGCDMKYSDGGWKIQLSLFFFSIEHSFFPAAHGWRRWSGRRWRRRR